MKIWCVSLCYMDMPIIIASLAMFYATKGDVEVEHILLDHHWPLDYWAHRWRILELAEIHGCRVMSPYENLGGHGGYDWVMRNTPMKDEDLLLTYDPDTSTGSVDWLAPMVRAVQDPLYGFVSMRIEADLLTKEWDEDLANGVRVIRPSHGRVEMINVSLYPVKFLREIGGFRAPLKYYGQVEGPLFASLRERNLLHGYVYDAVEVPRLVTPDARYQRWKSDHVSGRFTGNFDKWLERKNSNDR